jgi:hypothetical protein
VPDRGHEDSVAPRGIGVEKWFLRRHRGARQRRVLVGSRPESRRRGTLVAEEHLVPDAIAPGVDVAVASEELLLAVIADVSAVELVVGEEPTAHEPGRGAEILEDDRSVDDDAAHRGGLGNRPHLSGVVIARGERITGVRRIVGRRARQVDIQRQIRERPPEVVGSVADATGTLVEDVDRTIDYDVARLGAKPRDLGVVADLEVQWVGSGTVGAGSKKIA